MKNIFELSLNGHISEGVFKKRVHQCKLERLKSQQEFSKKEEWFLKNWMTEKPVNQHNLEKRRTNNEDLLDLLNTKHLIGEI